MSCVFLARCSEASTCTERSFLTGSSDEEHCCCLDGSYVVNFAHSIRMSEFQSEANPKAPGPRG